MQLSQEDSLRLNVLLNQALQAIRIDEGKMIVYGLTERGEAKIQLNPNCKDELYIRRVKEAISSHIRLARWLSGVSQALDSHGSATRQ